MWKRIYNFRILLVFLGTLVSLNSFSQEMMTPKKVIGDRPNELRFRALYSMTNYNLDSSGFANSRTSSLGSGYEFVYRKIKTDGIYRVLASAVQTEFDNSAGLSPNKFQTEIIRRLFDFQFNTGFGIGLEYRERIADRTSPNQAMPNSYKGSVRGFYASNRKLDDSFKIDYEFGLILPFVQSEKYPKTGAPAHVIAPDLEVSLVYTVNHFIEASLGVQLLYEQNNFSGAGDRGTSSATETFIHTHFPLELRFRF